MSDEEEVGLAIWKFIFSVLVVLILGTGCGYLLARLIIGVLL